jgi:nucleoid-associated protein YgaU
VKRIFIVGAVGVVAIVAALVLSQYLDTEEPAPAPIAATNSGAPAAPASEGAQTAQPSSAEVAALSQGGAASAPGQTQTQPQPQPQGKAITKSEKAPAGEGPSFDVVRIDPRGDAVIAGRAKPNSTVTVFDDGRELGTVIADSRGEWVLLPATPLEAGSRELTLSAKDDRGGTSKSNQSVVLVVPDRKKQAGEGGQSSAVAVLVPNVGGGGTVLQPPTPEGGEGIAQDGLSLDIIDYDENGDLMIGGRAPMGASIQVYIDNEPVGGVIADGNGRWQVKPAKPVSAGLHTLRVDQVAPPNARVIARVETPFSRAAFAEAAPGSIVVQPGNSLWRIARRNYGHGIRYSLIFEANKEQIRDPDLIYPGQVFVLPKH